MKHLKEYLKEAVQNNLSDFQKGLLASITQAATTDQAYQLATGSQNSMAALHQLHIMGYIVIHGKSVGITSAGRDAAMSNNLLDTAGKLTDEGSKQIAEYNRNKQEYVNAV